MNTDKRLQRAGAAPGETAKPAASATVLSTVADAPINILIVDDEPKNLTVLESLLDAPGYRLVRAESADQALLALVAEEFALLILDIRMPGMTGFELAQIIKGRKKTARVPIIFLTAYYNEDQHVIEGYGSGAVDYLHKPVNAPVLRSKVAIFAELHRKNREIEIANRALLAEVGERRHAEMQLRELNDVLDRRVVERTDALHASDARLRMATDAVGLAIWACNRADGAWIWENEWPQQILGVARELWPRRTSEVAELFMVPAERAAFERAFGATLAAQGPLHFEGRLRRADGGSRWVEFDGDFVAEPDGPGRVLGTLRDTTERRLAEQKLRERERFMRTVTDAARLGLAVIEPGDRYRYANDGYAQMLGVPLEAIVGQPAAVALAGPWALAAPVLRLAFGGAPGAFEFSLGSGAPGAPQRHFAAFLEPHTDLAGERTVVMIVVEISELKRLELQLRAADRRKDEFLATLAHELRNPLAPIRHAIQILHPRASERRESNWAAQVVERQVGVMVRLIDDLMDVARINQGRIELRTAKVNLADVLESAVEASRPHIDEFGHEFRLALPPGPIHLDADLTRLSQVFMNLLSNAAKYTHRGGRIELAAQLGDGELSISVKDNGIGIDPAHLGSVFDMFSQVESALVRSRGGLGIGLSLARRLVELHGGRIEARSAGLGLGSEFVVRLPLHGEGRGDAGAPAAEPTRLPLPGARPSLRVLVVDDNRDGADSLAALLSLGPDEVRTAYDGEEALAVMQTFRPDAVLLDIAMPKLNGHETCRRLRGLSWGAAVTVIAMTGWGDPDAQREVQASGFDHHFVKPVEGERLTAALDAVRARLGGRGSER